MQTYLVIIGVLLGLLHMRMVLGQDSSSSCQARSIKVGCYKDKRFKEALGVMLFQDRSEHSPKFGGELIDWANFGAYLKRLVCRCATAAKAKGYTHFGLQFYGVCYSAPDDSSDYATHGRSDQCVDQYQIACNDEEAGDCVGLGNANYVYRITSA